MMHKSLLILAFTTVLSGAAFAQNTAQTAPVKPTVQAMCKDGTPFAGESLKGACRGHGGVDKTAGKAAAVPDKAMKPAGGTDKAAGAPVAQAVGAGPGKVWVNDATKVYHCQGNRYYGKTKRGEYMAEADAKAKGFRGDRGKSCDPK